MRFLATIFFSCFLVITSISNLYAAQEEFTDNVEALAQKLTSSTTGKVLGTERDLIYINLGEKDFIREGTVFEVVRLGDIIESGETTYRKERPIGDIEVTRVRKNMSYAKAKSTYAQIKAGDRVYQKRKKISRVALTEFPYRSGYNDLTKNVYERLTIYFAQKGLQVVERSKLNSVLQEQKISYSGIMDVSTAQKLGKLVGAEAVLVGSVSDLRDDIAINARLVDVESGTFMTAALVELRKTPAVKSMLERGHRMASSGKDQTQFSSTGSQDKTTSALQDENKENVVEQNGFIFKPISCKRKINKLIFEILFINNGEQDRELHISGGYDDEYSSYIYDNHGNQYNPYIIIGNYKGNRWIEQIFVPKVPIRVYFIVNEVQSDIKYITAAIRIENFKQRVTIKNIPIKK
jgi:TolB-like protein